MDQLAKVACLELARYAKLISLHHLSPVGLIGVEGVQLFALKSKNFGEGS